MALASCEYMHMSLYFINYKDTCLTKLDISYYVAVNNRVRKQVSVASLYMRARKSVQRNFPVHHEFALKSAFSEQNGQNEECTV